MIKAFTQCGLILDTLGRDGLRRVRDCHDTLNAVYEEAHQMARDAEQAAAVVTMVVVTAPSSQKG